MSKNGKIYSFLCIPINSVVPRNNTTNSIHRSCTTDTNIYYYTAAVYSTVVVCRIRRMPFCNGTRHNKSDSAYLAIRDALLQQCCCCAAAAAAAVDRDLSGV